MENENCGFYSGFCKCVLQKFAGVQGECTKYEMVDANAFDGNPGVFLTNTLAVYRSFYLYEVPLEKLNELPHVTDNFL